MALVPSILAADWKFRLGSSRFVMVHRPRSRTQAIWLEGRSPVGASSASTRRLNTSETELLSDLVVLDGLADQGGFGRSNSTEAARHRDRKLPQLMRAVTPAHRGGDACREI